MIIYNKDQQIVGELKENVYYTTRRVSHFMRKYQGFGISDEIIKELASNGCTIVSITYEGKEGTLKFNCSLRRFMNSQKTHFFEGRDLQKFVSVKNMNDPQDVGEKGECHSKPNESPMNDPKDIGEKE